MTVPVPNDELEVSYVRSSGPGGQNVNKTATKAVVRWNVAESSGIPPAVRNRFLSRFAARITQDGAIVLTGDRFRSQERNLADVLERLASLLAQVERPPKPRRPTKPSRRAKQRRLTEKKQRSQTKAARKPPRGDD